MVSSNVKSFSLNKNEANIISGNTFNWFFFQIGTNANVKVRIDFRLDVILLQPRVNNKTRMNDCWKIIPFPMCFVKMSEERGLHTEYTSK